MKNVHFLFERLKNYKVYGLDGNDLLFLAIIILVSGFFLFYQIPQDFGDDCITFGIIAHSINSVQQNGIPITEIFNEISNLNEIHKMYFSTDIFEKLCFGTPFWNLLLSFSFKIFGESVASTLFLSSFLGFLTIILTYFLAREMYGQYVGFLASLMLSVSLYLVILSRSGSGFIPLVVVTALLTLLFFYSSHVKKSKKLLWIAGIVGGLSFFNGYTPSFLVGPIILGFILWNIDYVSILATIREKKWTSILSSMNKRGYLFSIRDYLILGIILLGSFLVFTVLYSIYLRVDLFHTLSTMYDTRIAVSSYLSDPEVYTNSFKIANAQRFFSDIFIAINPNDILAGVHTQQYLTMRPLVAPFISIFFFIGLLFSSIRRNYADKLCLIWLAVVVIVFTLFEGFINRAGFLIVPVIYILSGVGITGVIQKIFEKLPLDGSRPLPGIKKKEIAGKGQTKENDLKRMIIIGIFIFFIVLTIICSYNDILVIYNHEQDGNIPRYYGTASIGNYLAAHADPNDSVLVIGDLISVPYDAIYFHSHEAVFPVQIWWEDLLFKKFGGRSEAWIDSNGTAQGTVADLDRWEQQTLSEKKNIFYIFRWDGCYIDLPGWNLFMQVDWHEFQELHPTLQPVIITEFSRGNPALALYQVNSSTPRFVRTDATIGNPSSVPINSSAAGIFAFIEIHGPADNISITGGSNQWNLPIRLFPNEQMRITYDNFSDIIFTPHFDSPALTDDVYHEDNITTDTQNGLVGNGQEKASLTYKIESPVKINKLSMRTNPRIFNDINGKNFVQCLYSTDGVLYTQIYDMKSNENGNWSVYQGFGDGSGFFERESYNVIYPDSNMVYIKFQFSGQPFQCQLITPAGGDHEMLFQANIDTTDFKQLSFDSGQNTFSIFSDVPGGSISLGMKKV